LSGAPHVSQSFSFDPSRHGFQCIRDALKNLVGAPGRYPTLAGRDFRMAPTHRGCALASVTDHHHRQLLSADHFHHGLLGRECVVTPD
jgi:hypothetical protein